MKQISQDKTYILHKCLEKECQKFKRESEEILSQHLQYTLKIVYDINRKLISNKEGLKLVNDHREKAYKSITQRKKLECQLDKCYKETYDVMMSLHNDKKSPEYNKIVTKYINKFKRSRITPDDLTNLKIELEDSRTKIS